MNIRSSDPVALLQLPPNRRMQDAEALRVYLSAVHYSLADSLLIGSPQDIRCLKDISVEPYLHQVENLRQFVNHHQPRMMLFDEVGLGKTISTGLILAELAQRRRITNFLIVCPGILVEQWKQELEGKFGFRDVLAGKWADIAPGLQNSDPGTLKVVTTYDAVRRHADFFGSRTWDFVVADEGDHLARVYTGAGFDPSQRARVFREMLRTDRVSFFLLLTATPLRKDLWQLFSLAELAALPGRNPLGPHTSFASTFIQGDPRRAVRIKPPQLALFRQRMAEISARTSRKDLHTRQQLAFPERRVENVQVPFDPAEHDLIKSYQAFLAQRCNLYQNISREALNDLLGNWADLVLEQEPRSLDELGRISEAVCDTLEDFQFAVAETGGPPFQSKLSYRLVSEAFVSFARARLPPETCHPDGSLSALIRSRFPALAEEFFEAEIERKRRSNRLEEISLAQSVLSSPAAAAGAFARKLEKVRTQFERKALQGLVDKAEAIREPQKAKKLLELVRGLAGARPDDFRVLIFTTRLETQVFLIDYLQRNGFEGQLCQIRGGAGNKNVQAARDFQGPELQPGPGYGLPRKHILVSSDAGAVGVNLQACNTMVNYDLPWIPTILEQRIGRIQRLGQTAQFVLVNNLVVTGSLEETILARLYERLELFSMAIGELEAILSAPADEGMDFNEWVLKLIELQAQGRNEEVSKQLESMNRSAAKTELRELQEKNDQLLGTLLSPADDPRFTRGRRADPPLDVRAFAEAAYPFLGAETRLEGDGQILCVSDGPSPDRLFPTWQRYVFEEPDVAADSTAPTLLAEGTKAFVELGARVLKRGGVAFRSCLPLEVDTKPESLRQSIGTLDARVTVGTIDVIETSPDAVWGLTWVLTTRASRDRFDKLLTFLTADSEAKHGAIKRLQSLPSGQLLQLPPLEEAAYSRPPSADVIQRQLTECVNSDEDVNSFVAHYRLVGEKKIQDLRNWHQEKSQSTLGRADWQADVDRDRALLDTLRQEYAPSVDARVVMVTGFVYRRMERKATCHWAGGTVTFTTNWTWVPLTESGTLHLRCTICSDPTSGPDTTCDAGHLACDRHIHRCAVAGCSRRACPQCLAGRLTECVLSGLLACPDHLAECASCASEILAPLLFRVEELEQPVCAECFDVCEASGGLHLTTELERSEMSGSLVHHRLLVPCAETGRRALASELAACAETGALVDPRLLERCAASGRMVLARLLVESPVSARRFLPSCGARDEISGDLCLPEELSNCAVSGRRVRLDRLARSTLSGIHALPSEMVTCPLSGDSLLPSETVRCEETGRLLSPRATATCELTRVRAGRDLFGVCSISGQIILSRSLAVSAVSGRLGRPDLMGVDEVDGALALPTELAVCSVSGKRILGIKLVNSDISSRRAQSSLLVQCQETQKRVCPDELQTCQASGARVIPECLAIDEVTGKRVLERLLVTCGITGKRTLAEATEECVLSGIRALRSECEQCAVTGQWALKGRLDASVVSGKRVLPPLLRESAVTAEKALPEEMVRCQESGSLAIPGELEICGLSGRAVLPNLLTTCPDLGIRLLTRLAVRCDSTGVLVHPDAIGISEASGRLVRSALLKTSDSSSRRCLEEELRTCEASGKRVFADELERCAVTGKRVLPAYLGPCAICDRRSLKKGQLRCKVCEAYYCADCIEDGRCRTCRALARPLVGIEALDDEVRRTVLRVFPGVGRVCFARNSKWVIVYAEPKMFHFSQKSRVLVIERRSGGYSVLRSNYEFRLQ